VITDVVRRTSAATGAAGEPYQIQVKFRDEIRRDSA